MHETLQSRDGPFVPLFEEFRWTRSQHRENARDRSLNRRDAAEGERGGEESDDLAIRRIGELVGEDERVRIEAAGAPLAPESLEVLAEEGEVPGAARAPSHPPTLASPW